MLKSQHRRQEARWRELMEAREQALSALKERQALLETELGVLRRRARADDELVVAEVFDAGSRLEAAQKAFAEERAAHEAEAARWREAERLWQKKEQQYLLDLRELQAPAETIAAVEGRLEQLARVWQESLRQEREAWRADVSAKDQAQVELAEKLAAVMERVAELERRPAVMAIGGCEHPRRLSWSYWLALAAVAAGLLLAAAWSIGRWVR